METSQLRFMTSNQIHFSKDNPSSKYLSFHLFTHLPPEIKLKVWELSLPCRRRLFTLCLNHEAKNDAGVVHGYKVSIEQPPRPIPQSSVCVESRKVVRQFFRLSLLVIADNDRPLTVWINPESDHLFLRKFDVDITTFANFIIDIKSSDPQRKGILHIAFDSLCRTSVPSLKALSADLANDVPQETIAALSEWVLGLKSIWFIHLLSSESRLGAGPISGTGNSTIKGLNRSMPLFPHAVEFDLFEEDIRPYQSSLKSHTVFYNPNAAVKAWEAMENELGIRSDARPHPARQISHILAVTARQGYLRPASAEVRSARSMDDYLQLEQERTKDFFTRGGGTFFPQWRETEEQKRNLLSAAGFWVFPYGTFDTLEEKLVGKACQDLSDQRPGLGLFEL